MISVGQFKPRYTATRCRKVRVALFGLNRGNQSSDILQLSGIRKENYSGVELLALEYVAMKADVVKAKEDGEDCKPQKARLDKKKNELQQQIVAALRKEGFQAVNEVIVQSKMSLATSQATARVAAKVLEINNSDYSSQSSLDSFDLSEDDESPSRVQDLLQANADLRIEARRALAEQQALEELLQKALQQT